ncbi:MAG: DUF6159 family protein [Minisyncoccota bacterium]
MLIVYALVGVLYFYSIFNGDTSAVRAAADAAEGGTPVFTQAQEWISYLILFVTYLLSFLVVNFFQAGVMTIARARFEGRDLTFGDGIRAAASKFGPIFIWSFISATVGTILDRIAQSSGWFGKLISGMLGAAWNILTYFSLPALVLGDATIIGSFKESAAMIRKTWGETIIVNVGVGLFFGLVILGAGLATICAVIVAATVSDVFAGVLMLVSFVLFILFVLLVAVVASALGSIFKTALYEYARTGIVPQGFSSALIRQAIGVKK